MHQKGVNCYLDFNLTIVLVSRTFPKLGCKGTFLQEMLAIRHMIKVLVSILSANKNYISFTIITSVYTNKYNTSDNRRGKSLHCSQILQKKMLLCPTITTSKEATTTTTTITTTLRSTRLKIVFQLYISYSTTHLYIFFSILF